MTFPRSSSSDSELSAHKSTSSPPAENESGFSKILEDGVGLPRRLDWQRWDCSKFSVDYAVEGTDIIYHFWPPGADRELPDSFLGKFADVFRSILPTDVQPEGAIDFADDQETRYRVGEPAITRPDGAPKIFQDTAWIRVPRIMHLIGADTRMTTVLFARLEAA